MLAATASAALSLAERSAELEAKATAYIVADHFSLAHESPNYLALWTADAAKLQARFTRIQKATAQIITAVEPQPEPIE